MKKVRFLSLLLTACMLFTLCACNSGGDSTESTTDPIYGSVSASVSGSASVSFSASAAMGASSSASSSAQGSDTEPPENVAVDLRANGYLVIRPEGASSAIVQAAQSLHAAMQSASLAGANDLKDDWIKRGTEPPAYEILCGACDRTELESFTTLMRVNDFVIAVSGTKIVLLGGSDQATADAISYFTTNYISAGVTAFGAGTLYEKNNTYPVMDFKIGDHDITEYTILHATDDYSKMIAEDLQAQLSAMTGYKLPLLSGAQSAATAKDTEILVGKTTRNLTNALSARQYQFSIKNGKVHLECGNAVAVGYAANDFLSAVNAKKNGATVSFSSTLSGATGTIGANMPICFNAAGSNMRIMSFNILGGSASTVTPRVPYLKSFFSDYMPDIIGMQEVNATQHSNTINYLKQNGYTLATVASGNGSYTPILFRTDKYTKLTSGQKMLDSRYKGTGTKSIAWVVLQEKATGKKFAVINSHFSLITEDYTDADLKKHNGLTDAQLTPSGRTETAIAWRCDNARQAVSILSDLRKTYGAGLPVFVLGDLNSTEGSSPLAILADAGMVNCKYQTTKRDTGGSSHDLGSTTTGASPIDHIYVTSGGADVFFHEIVRDDNTTNGSDHFPVFCDVKLK